MRLARLFPDFFHYFQDAEITLMGLGQAEKPKLEGYIYSAKGTSNDRGRSMS